MSSNRTTLVLAFVRGACAALLACALLAPEAHALKPHMRDGWIVGLGLGYGPAKLALGPLLGGETSGRLSGSSTQIRLAHTLGQHAAFGLEQKAWLDEEGFGETKVRASLQNFTAALTWYPGNPQNDTGGIYVRAGVGWATGRFTVFDNAGSGVDTSSVEAHIDESGVGVLFGAGYEFRIVRPLAVGLDVTGNYQSIEKEAFINTWYVPVTISLNWYFGGP